MNDIFLKLFNMSITAGWVIMAVIALRFFLRRAPKWLHCALWAIVAVRLVCPFSIESMFSLIPRVETISTAELQHTAASGIDTEIPAAGNPLNPMSGETDASLSGNSEAPLQTWIFAGSIVWLGGLAILLGYALLSFLRIRRKVEEGVLLYPDVYLCDAVQSPFILGIVRPRIYLPSDTEELQLGYVLAHERAHLKRKDHWWKPFGYALLAVYWFHPLVWIAYILLCRDIELACDEKAVHDFNLEGRKAYSNALVACSMRRRMIMVCPLAFGEVGVKIRVKTVLNYRKPAFWLVILAVAVCVSTAFCFLTDPRKSVSLAEMIEAEKEELTDQIGTVISEAEAVRYSITDWELIVKQIDGERADCVFGANWISSRRPEEDPMIQGMYETAERLTDETGKALALETAEEWLIEMQFWPEEEYLEQPIVIMREGSGLALYYPYVMDGLETLIPLQQFVDENWTEDREKRYQAGVSIIENALLALSPDISDMDASEDGSTNDDIPGGEIKVKINEGINHYDLISVDDDSMLLDEVEWIGYTDTERAAELGIDFGQYMGSYYIYNETESVVRCFFAEECSFTLLDWADNFAPIEVDKQTFLAVMAERESVYATVSQIPFIIEIADGKIISVREQYVQ